MDNLDDILNIRRCVFCDYPISGPSNYFAYDGENKTEYGHLGCVGLSKLIEDWGLMLKMQNIVDGGY